MKVVYRLTEDQAVGRDFLADRARCVLADDVGYGKTAEVLSAISLLGLRRVLYVTGAQACYQACNEDVPKFSPHASARVIRGSARVRRQLWRTPPTISFVGYETFRSDVELLEKVRWDLVVLDDASKFKNPVSALALAANRVTSVSARAWAMTATPIENELADLWSIFHAIDLHPLGTWPEFNAEYCIWGWKQLPGGSQRQVMGYRNLDQLKERLKGHILRRADGSGPDIILATHLMGVLPRQAELYLQARAGHFGPSVFDRFTRCLMYLDSTVFSGDPDPVSSKIDTIIFILEHYEGKVVIYSQWKPVLRHLKEVLNSKGWPFVEISGDVPLFIRAENQRRFREDASCQICLVTKAAEQALNLEAAQLLITINRIANPARMYQVHGRIKRRNSRFDRVYVLDLVIEDSLEERMLNLSEHRRALPAAVFGDDLPTRFTTAAMAALLRADEGHQPRIRTPGSPGA